MSRAAERSISKQHLVMVSWNITTGMEEQFANKVTTELFDCRVFVFVMNDPFLGEYT